MILTVMLLLLLPTLAVADTLELANGNKIEGKFVDRANGMVRFEVDGVVTAYSEKDVKNIILGPAGAGTATGAPGQSVQSGAVTVPAGTTFMVRTREALDSSRHRAGHKFTAILEADLVANGTVVAPKGSTVYGELTEAKQARRLAGRSEMTITFTGLMIDNQIRPLQSGSVNAVAETGSAGETVGRTARGAIIGGLIDGSDGAKTGAKVGAGVSVLTRGSQINIPSGTLLEIPLAAPFTP
jgi:hypothetical protein